MNNLKSLNNRQLVLCFQVHQPRRLRKLNPAELSTSASLLDEKLDQTIMERVANTCYIPANKLLLKLMERHPEIRIVFSISGVALEQMEHYAPETLESFKALAATGSVDFLLETYYHSLAFLMDSEEFEIQILEHAEKISEHFGVHPWVFRNTNLFYNDDIGRRISMMGFQGVLTEGNDRALRGNAPQNLYEHRDLNGLKILLRSHRLSDDIAFHAALPEWNLTAAKYMSWLENMPENEKLVILSLDYETFGEHHKEETGIFHFLEEFLLLLSMQNTYQMITPAEVVQFLRPSRPISIPDYITLSGCDLSTWVGNDRQREAFSALISLEPILKEKNDPGLLRLWRYLQTSDHYYYMSDSPSLSPYTSPQEAHDLYMHAIRILSDRIYEQPHPENDPEKINEALEAERRNLNAPIWAMSIDPRHGYSQ